MTPASEESPRATASEASAIRLQLQQSFRFVHEPLAVDTTSRFVGRTSLLDRLVERILYSNGGSILLTGYRGVGKTSLVNQLVRTMNDVLPLLKESVGEFEIVDVQINLA